jgi:hypothetical protein
MVSWLSQLGPVSVHGTSARSPAAGTATGNRSSRPDSSASISPWNAPTSKLTRSVPRRHAAPITDVTMVPAGAAIARPGSHASATG